MQDACCGISGVLRVRLPGGFDERGAFFELFRLGWLPEVFDSEVQVNCSISERNALRGLHFHRRQADLWFACSGRVRAALVDVRAGAPGFGRGEMLDLDGSRPEGLLIPPGVAHGYLALERSCIIYVVSRFYDGSDEQGIAWDDPDLGLEWGCENPILSGRDRSNPPLKSLSAPPVESGAR